MFENFGVVYVPLTTLHLELIHMSGRLPLRECDGQKPLRFSIEPALPAGLHLSPHTGTISGTPSEAMTSAPQHFQVQDQTVRFTGLLV